MNNIEKMKAALGEPIKRDVGGMEIEFWPLPVKYLPDFYEIAKKSEKGDLEKVDMEIMTNLIKAFVSESNPDFKEPDLSRFCMKFFPELQLILSEIHNPEEGSDSRRTKTLNELRERVAKAKKPKATNEGSAPGN